MVPIEHYQATIKEAVPLLRECFSGDPLAKAVARLTRQADAYALLDGMPKQFTSDAKQLASLLTSLPVFVQRGDTANAVLVALDIGKLAERLALQSAHESKVIRVNSTTRKFRQGAKAQEHAPADIDNAIQLFNLLLRGKPQPKKDTIYRKVQEQTGIPPRTLRYHLKKRDTNR